MEYDFDEMARHFNSMRRAYMKYREGGVENPSSKLLENYLALSELFFRKYPNPFSSDDQDFSPSSKEHVSRSSLRILEKELSQYKILRSNIEERIKILESRSISQERIQRFKNYLDQCNQKIKDVELKIHKAETSRLPA